MSGAELGLALSVFLACTVEAVEALTIVLAVGSTRSWSSAMGGVGAAMLALAVIVAALGPAITSLPIDVLSVPSAACCWSSACSGCARRSCAPPG